MTQNRKAKQIEQIVRQEISSFFTWDTEIGLAGIKIIKSKTVAVQKRMGSPFHLLPHELLDSENNSENFRNSEDFRAT